ncbi:TPA: AacA34 family aminoglycoside 6'-N-acetyltransferase, partial [Pseudomonas aeruginosa]
MKEQDAADWLALRNLLWLADDHASEIEQYFSGGF